jgi:hypothetical protein
MQLFADMNPCPATVTFKQYRQGGIITMRLPVDDTCQDVTVKRLKEAGYNEEGQWVEGGEQDVAAISNADIQPKSGRERSAQSGTSYESDYTMYVGTDDIVWQPGYTRIKEGDIIIDAAGNKYKVVFPGFWPGSHYQSDLKLEAAADAN